MISNEGTGQESRFPKECSPSIFVRTKGKYSRFSIQKLYLDLFVTVASYADSAFVVFPNGHEEKKGKELLSFLLPKEMFEYIEKRTVISDYRDYIVAVQKSNKIARLMQEMFYGNSEKYSGKMFAEAIRKHFLILLKDAVFSPFLKTELDSIAKVIVPEEISKVSHNAYSKLVNGQHKSVAIAIANIFASAMLGLYSMKYIVTKYDKDAKTFSNADQYVKTYLLNELGLRYIWAPNSVTTSYEELFEIEKAFEYGNMAVSYENGLKWLKEHENDAPSKEQAKAYQIIGFSLFNLAAKKEKGFEFKKAESIKLLKKCILTGEAEPYVYWFLYNQCKDEEPKTAAGYLETALAQNCAKAVVEVAFSFLFGEKNFIDITEKSLLEKIDVIISEEQKNDADEVGKCLYLRGRFAQMHGNISEAQNCFEAAAGKGNERAKQELIRKERNAERGVFPSFSNQPNVNCCFANTLTGTNYQVVSTFPGEKWALYAPVKTTVNGIQFAQSIDAFINSQHIGMFEFCRPKLVFLFMSENEEKNLNDCLELLDKLFNRILNVPVKQKWELIDNTYIYVSANYETASMLIDANISQMGNGIYFKVHIADENRDTVHKLLCDAPLFLPALNGTKSENMTKVVLFGSSELNYCFVRESIACAYSGEKHPIDITLLGESADTLESRFKRESPGVFGYPNITCIRPKFIKCSIKETDFPALIDNHLHLNPSASNAIRRDAANDSIAEILRHANYFIVDFSDDLENIRFAMELRTWLLRSRGLFDRAPFIGVRIADKQNSYLTSHLTLSGQAAGNSYYNKYDLFPFGISAQTYHYENIIENPVLDLLALQVHKFYYLDNNLDKNDEVKLKEALDGCKRSAENDFYSYSYNADSSIATAIGLCYRFFAAGCALPSKADYLNFGALKAQCFLTKFTKQLNSSSKEKLAKLEQIRWNSFMLIRGWLPADIEQVEKYEEQSSGSAHKHILAKLHPFIREWEDLDDPELERILGVLKSKANYDKKPQVTTARSIDDTIRFFGNESRDEENMH